jgi:hypothetical protein
MATNLSDYSSHSQIKSNMFERKYKQAQSDFFLVSLIGAWTLSYKYISKTLGKGVMINYISSFYISYFLTKSLFYMVHPNNRLKVDCEN